MWTERNSISHCHRLGAGQSALHFNSVATDPTELGPEPNDGAGARCLAGGLVNFFLAQELQDYVVQRSGPPNRPVFFRTASLLAELAEHRSAFVELSALIAFERGKAVVKILLLFFLHFVLRAGGDAFEAGQCNAWVACKGVDTPGRAERAKSVRPKTWAVSLAQEITAGGREGGLGNRFHHSHFPPGSNSAAIAPCK